MAYAKMQALLSTGKPVLVNFVRIWSPIVRVDGVWHDRGYFTTRAGAEIFAIGIGPNGTDANVVDHNAIKMGGVFFLLADGHKTCPVDGGTIIKVTHVPTENEEPWRTARLIESAKAKLSSRELSALGIK